MERVKHSSENIDVKNTKIQIETLSPVTCVFFNKHRPSACAAGSSRAASILHMKSTLLRCFTVVFSAVLKTTSLVIVLNWGARAKMWARQWNRNGERGPQQTRHMPGEVAVLGRDLQWLPAERWNSGELQATGH